ncbi:putative Avr9/Cf-9 rapidly elicited protein [Quillaja saponaria]|uniref:Avr9/Cf-9 rapidly elicited protein n=1 Tax=Quillaja saponaria TaxID=32244 RepID=A0AAD7L2D4_QUISA|nr:putative Avr9/Cf-9 rapidly elicited protein [Quillaja saponaria]
MDWLSRATHHHLFHRDKPSPESATLGILAFETAKTMSRLVSLYKSLTDEEIVKLRKQTMRSKGVHYLNSNDQVLLLNLACAERLEDVDLASATVSHLGQKCSDFALNSFDLVYTDLKLGIIDIRKLDFGTRNIKKIIDKMEKLIASTATLYSALESLKELELSEKKIQRLSKNLGSSQPNLEYFNHKIAYQRKLVQHYKEVSLWNQTFDKSVGLMARIVCVVYARICFVFGPYISGTNYLLIDQKEKIRERAYKSGPISKTRKTGLIGCTSCYDFGKNNRVFRMVPPSTVGGAGLSLRYANVVLFAERFLHAPATVGDDARGALYEMLPAKLKAMVRAKLRNNNLLKAEEKESGDESGDGHFLAEGWRDAMEEIMDWLSPLAHDTVKWQTERNPEKKKFESKTSILLLQTLHYSDLEKTEAAIVEVLVGLSCVYRYEKRRRYVGRDLG